MTTAIDANGRLSAAMEYASYNWPVVLVNGKVPFLPDWPSRATADEAELVDLFERHPRAGVGILCGERSGIVDMGINGDDGREVLSLIFGGEIPPTIAFQARRGVHYWFRWRPGLPSKARYFIGDKHLEIISGNTPAQVIVPPTESDGVRREWLLGCSPSECSLAEIDDEALARLAKWDGWGLDKIRSGGNGQAPPRADVLRDETIHEGGRNDALAKLAGRMRRSGFVQEEISAALLAANARRCSPPLPTSEVEAIAKSVVRYSPQEAIVRNGERAEPITYPSLTAGELDLEEYETEYLIPGILAARQHTIGGGPHKSLKTLTLGCDLALSLATGGHWLGYFPVARPVRTALMSGECGYPVLQDNLRRIARAAGTELRHVGNLLVSDHLPRFGHLDHCDAMGKFLADNELEVCIIDPVYLCMAGGDAANVFIMGDLLRSIGEVFVEHNATMVLLHHSTKPAGITGEPIDLADLSFAGFREFAASWLLLSRRAKYVPGTGHHELWLSAGGRAGHSGLWGLDVDEGEFSPGVERGWDVEVRTREDIEQGRHAAKQEKQEAAHREKLDEWKTRICRAMAKYPAGETAKVVRETAGMAPAKFNPALAELIQDGDAEPCEVHKTNRKAPYEGYRLITQ